MMWGKEVKGRAGMGEGNSLQVWDYARSYVLISVP